MSLDLPGFTDPVAGAQSCFRVVLDAMAHPGRIVVTGVGLEPPPPLDPAAAASLLTLTDADTPLWIEDAPNGVGEWLTFHCGAAFVPLAEARFAWLRDLPDLSGLHDGSDEAPETSATVILQVRALGSGHRLRLTGPGVKTTTDFAVDGLPANFVTWWQANHARFPRGIDLILTAGTALAALPRSVAVAEG